jgi:hypothetical protein
MQTLAQHCACHPDDPVCAVLWKSTTSPDGERVIEGLASLDIRDNQGEIVHPDRLDLSYLLHKGKINWHHGSDPGDQIGVVTDYKVGKVRDIVPARYHWRLKKYLDNVGLWIKGKLKRGLQKAEDAWLDISNNPGDHGLGFSVQGRAQRENGHVIGGLINAAALTHAPVLVETFVEMQKALTTSYAHADQRGGMAIVPEHLGGRMVTRTFEGPYGDENLHDAYSVDAVVGSRRLRSADGSLRRQPVTRRVMMPRGEDPGLKIPDVHMMSIMLRRFIKYLRQLGPIKGNVLDGSRTFFQMHGLDARSARVLEIFIRENADKVFEKAFLDTPEKLWKSWVEPSEPRPLTREQLYEQELEKAFDDADGMPEPEPATVLVPFDVPVETPVAAAVAPMAFSKSTQREPAPRRRRRIRYVASVADTQRKGIETMGTTIDYLDLLEKSIDADEHPAEIVSVDQQFTAMAWKFEALRKAAAFQRPTLPLIQAFEKSLNDLENVVRRNTELHKSFALSGREITGTQILAIGSAWRHVRDREGVESFRKLLLDVISGGNLRKSISNGACPICEYKNPVGSTECRQCACSLDVSAAPEEPPPVTKKDLAKFSRLLKQGSVPTKIAMMVDRGRINVTQANALLDNPAMDRLYDAIQRGLVGPELALRLDRGLVSPEDALKELAPPESRSAKWLALCKERRVPTSIAAQVDRGEISLKEAIDVVESLPG